MSTLSHRSPTLLATRPALMPRLWQAIGTWARDVWQARQARAAMYLQMQSLRQLDAATLRDLGLGDQLALEPERSLRDYFRAH